MARGKDIPSCHFCGGECTGRKPGGVTWTPWNDAQSGGAVGVSARQDDAE